MARTKKTEEAPKKVTKPRAKKETKPRASTKKIDDPVIVEETIIEEPSSAPSVKSYKVIAKHGLRVRTGASFDDKILRVLPYGTKVTVYEESNGWGRIGNGEWVSMNYLK